MASSGNPITVKYHGDANEVVEVTFVDSSIFRKELIERIGFALNELVPDLHPSRIILNFDGVDGSSSSVLPKYIDLRRRVINRGGTLLLCNLNEAHRELFRVTELDKMFEIVPTVESALEKMK